MCTTEHRQIWKMAGVSFEHVVGLVRPAVYGSFGQIGARHRRHWAAHGGTSKSDGSKEDGATMGRGSTTEPEGGGAEVHSFPDPPSAESATLTPRQRKVLEVIRDWVERFGYPPSVRDIGHAVGLPPHSSVHHQL